MKRDDESSLDDNSDEQQSDELTDAKPEVEDIERRQALDFMASPFW